MHTEFLPSLSRLTGKSVEQLNEIYRQPAFRGIRINPLATDKDLVLGAFDFALTATEFYEHEYYVPADTKNIGKHPLHHAGAVYSQEPSASAVIGAIDITPDMKILDLCAAPGGKTTGIGARLKGKGLIWANEFVHSRANILLSNIERMGLFNAVVSNLDTGYLCENLADFFDAVFVDAPCSGEGMCRHNPEAAEQWSPENVNLCVERQRTILANAVKAVKPGGKLVYSTCTFNRRENEENVAWLLQNFKDFSVIPVAGNYGTCGIGDYDFKNKVRRIFPWNGGEGHFIAVFERKDAPAQPTAAPIRQNITPEHLKLFEQFAAENLENLPNNCIFYEKNNQLYFAPPAAPVIKGAVLRYGVLAGEFKPNRFEPAHALFACPSIAVKRTYDFKLDDPKLSAYLHGEQIEVSLPYKGYVRISVLGTPLTFAKQSGTVLKNHYPKGLRNL